MEGLRVSCSRPSYNVIVIGKDFDHYVWPCPNAIFESEFH